MTNEDGLRISKSPPVMSPYIVGWVEHFTYRYAIYVRDVINHLLLFRSNSKSWGSHPSIWMVGWMDGRMNYYLGTYVQLYLNDSVDSTVVNRFHYILQQRGKSFNIPTYLLYLYIVYRIPTRTKFCINLNNIRLN